MQIPKAFTKLTMKLPALVLLALFGLMPAITRAAELTFSYDDPLGDNGGIVDVKKMTVVFDNETGAYKIVLRASAAHPFVGQFRINIGLYNPDVAANFSELADALNDYNLANAATTLTLTGTNGNLLKWAAGHKVVTNSGAGYGAPPWVNSFSSAVVNLPYLNPLSLDLIAQGTTGVTTVAEYRPQDALELLAENVEALRDIGVLTNVQAKYLLTPLGGATAALNQGQFGTACASLQVFIERVNEFKNQGVLPLFRAKSLIVAAQEIRTDLGC